MSSGTTDPGLGTAVVTGGAAGLGRAFAVALAQAGHAVAILDLADAAETLAEVDAHGVTSLSRVGDARGKGRAPSVRRDARRAGRDVIVFGQVRPSGDDLSG